MALSIARRIFLLTSRLQAGRRTETACPVATSRSASDLSLMKSFRSEE